MSTTRMTLLSIYIVCAAALGAGRLGMHPATAAGPWYVAPGGNDGYDCLSLVTACATINGALAKPGFVAGDTILVADGPYTGTGSEVVLLNLSAVLSGGWDATFSAQSGTTILDG